MGETWWQLDRNLIPTKVTQGSLFDFVLFGHMDLFTRLKYRLGLNDFQTVFLT